MDFWAGPAVSRGEESWSPANDTERRLHAAVRAGDVEEALRILVPAPLFLPGFPDDEFDAGQRVLTRERDGVPYLLLFTSPEALHRTVYAAGWRAVTLTGLVRAWPAGQGLAINPATPIGLLVAPQDVPSLVPTPEAVVDFVPANQVERLLRDALTSPDPEVLLDVLVTARVVVPVRPLSVDGEPTLPVFTSAKQCARFLAGLDVPTVTVDLVEVLRRWPAPDCRLAVNPGSAIGFSLRGSRIDDLLYHAAGLAHRRLGDVAEAGQSRVPRQPRPAAGGNVADLLRGG